MTITLEHDTKLFTGYQPGGLFSVQDVQFCPGAVFYVGNYVTGATDGTSYGKTPAAPFATLDYAFSQCTADRGDVIFVLPQHAETTVTASIGADIAGVTVIGLGNGQNKPTFTCTGTAGDINVTADDITIKNIRMVSGVNNLVDFLDLDANDFTCEDCEFITASTKEAVAFVDIATTKDNFTFRRCRFEQPTDPEGTDAAAGTGAFYFVDSENIIVENCYFKGYFETAIFHNKTTAGKLLWVKDSYLEQLLSTGVIFEMVDGITGSCPGCLGHSPNADDATDAKVMGTIGTKFWIHPTSGFGNDSAAGGQLAAQSTVCS